MSSPDNSIKLDVGGTIFKTSKSTLTRFDGFFKTMLETDVPIARNQENCIFIDRSPKHFDLILNFMRDGDVDLPDSDEKVKEISREADFYLLEGLMELCRLKLKSEGKSGKFRFLDSYDQVLEVISNAEKPTIIIYYSVGYLGQLLQPLEPNNFDTAAFCKKYSNQFEIYFKKSEVFKTGDNTKDSRWHLTIRYKKITRYFAYKLFEFSKLIEERVQEFSNENPGV